MVIALYYAMVSCHLLILSLSLSCLSQLAAVKGHLVKVGGENEVLMGCKWEQRTEVS